MPRSEKGESNVKSKTGNDRKNKEETHHDPDDICRVRGTVFCDSWGIFMVHGGIHGRVFRGYGASYFFVRPVDRAGAYGCLSYCMGGIAGRYGTPRERDWVSPLEKRSAVYSADDAPVFGNSI